MKKGICVGEEEIVRWRRKDGEMVMKDILIKIEENRKMI